MNATTVARPPHTTANNRGQRGREKRQVADPMDIKNIFAHTQFEYKIVLHVNEVGKNLHETFLKYVRENVEGRCIEEGWVRPGSVKIVQHSAGSLLADSVHYDFRVVLECDVCFPVDGMIIPCVVRNVVEIAAISAEANLPNNAASPVLVYLYRDFHHHSPEFAKLKKKDEIVVRVKGSHYAYGDRQITVIGQLANPGNPVK